MQNVKFVLSLFFHLRISNIVKMLKNKDIKILGQKYKKRKNVDLSTLSRSPWRRLSESDRSSEFCRLVPYRLAKAPYLVLFIKKWSGKRGSNPRPMPWQGIALSTELFPQVLN